MTDRIGIELPHIYDGISVWVEPDGTYTNRWTEVALHFPDDQVLAWRARATDEWIERSA